MVFCNLDAFDELNVYKEVTILILIDGFLQFAHSIVGHPDTAVTILILIDGFLQ